MRVACVQCDVEFNDPAVNVDRIVASIAKESQVACDLILFPECALTGYCVSSSEQAQEIALDGWQVQGNSVRGYPRDIQPIIDASAKHNVVVIVGYAGIEQGNVINGALLIEPSGKVSRYAKTHLPELGLDRYVEAGNSLPVFETQAGKIGILICFDIRMPEAIRTLALKGAEIVCLPTNWPRGAEVSADLLSPARAAENRVFLATCNRAGEENGFHFIGRSGIFDVGGKPLARAGDGEETICAEIDLAEARIKRNITIPGVHETTVFESRRPELYGTLTEPKG